MDVNSQPNGRHSGSYSAQFFFHPKFSQIAPPREGEKNFEEKYPSSVMFEFNRAQRQMGKGTCGLTAATEWLKKFRSKTALHSSMTDYCDTCKQEISRVHAIMNHLQQSGSASESELRGCQERKFSLKDERKLHKKTASEAREFFNSCMDE